MIEKTTKPEKTLVPAFAIKTRMESLKMYAKEKENSAKKWMSQQIELSFTENRPITIVVKLIV